MGRWYKPAYNKMFRREYLSHSMSDYSITIPHGARYFNFEVALLPRYQVPKYLIINRGSCNLSITSIVTQYWYYFAPIYYKNTFF